MQHKPDDEDPTGAALHAADEPTAVWDSEMLRQAGLDALSEVPEPSDSPPATAAQATAPSIVVEGSPSGPARASTPDASARRPGMSWPTTLAIAAIFGAAVYALIRYLR